MDPPVRTSRAEARQLGDPEFVEVGAGSRRSFGPFDLEFLAVNHSIPDALAVAIRTQAGLVLHTGDVKMDQLPLDGRLTDLGGFARLGEAFRQFVGSTGKCWRPRQFAGGKNDHEHGRAGCCY